MRSQVEAGNYGKIVAIDLEIRDVEVDASEIATYDRLEARHPDARIWIVRIGSRHVHRFGGRWKRTKSGKDNSGDKIYVKKSDGSGDLLFDGHNHWIVDHDLFNHEGLTEDGIAEAFIEFAKKENLSFFKSSPSVTPFDAVRYQP